MLDKRLRKIFQSAKKVLREYIKEDDTVINIGCGPGFFTIEAAKMVGANGRVVAVALQSKMLDYAKKKAIEKHMAGY